MSVSKKDQVFPSGSATSNERFVTALIAKALRDDYGALGSAVKRIGRRIGANPRAIRNWYEGRNAPNSVHILLLAQSSPRVFEALLELIGRTDLLGSHSEGKIIPNGRAGMSGFVKNYGEENFTINLSITCELRCLLNHRQLWFLSLLQEGENVKATDISSSWEVSLRTARTDISHLLKHKAVRYEGAKRRGKYEVINRTQSSSSGSPMV